MKRGVRAIRADIVWFCTTVFLLILFLFMFVSMNKSYNELLEVNEELIQTIEKSREDYDKNIQSYRDEMTTLSERCITAESYRYYYEYILEEYGIPVD